MNEELMFAELGHDDSPKFARLTETLESRRGCVLDDGILHSMLIHAKNYEELIALQIAVIKKIEAIAETKTSEEFAKLSEKEIRQSFALSILESEKRKKAEKQVAELRAALEEFKGEQS